MRLRLKVAATKAEAYVVAEKAARLIFGASLFQLPSSDYNHPTKNGFAKTKNSFKLVFG